ncbi:hypothetical protein NDU88_002865 [Pleurodeles waltl]|uniref:Uncharacterized protein n=1 Tax=Pleurodeles waltl TaxID=8319 RepID=A0AAV7RE07_PLEWA|nr:hypothetical protein NDU88_002865 [Pleurodeles waltl]
MQIIHCRPVLNSTTLEREQEQPHPAASGSSPMLRDHELRMEHTKHASGVEGEYERARGSCCNEHWYQKSLKPRLGFTTAPCAEGP